MTNRRDWVVLSLGLIVGAGAASLYWHRSQWHSQFIFDHNLKCQQIAKQYQAENRVAVLKVAYSPSRNSCIAEVTRPPQNGAIDFTVDDMLSGEILFVGHWTVDEFASGNKNEKFKALSTWRRAGKPKPVALVWYKDDNVVRVAITTSNDDGQSYVDY